jgi:hypothetical protein
VTTTHASARYVLSIFRGDIARLVGVLVASATLALALGMIFPVQHELDVAAYSHSRFAIEAPVALTGDAAANSRLRKALGGSDVTLESIFSTEFSVGDNAVGPSELLVIAESSSRELGLMPAATRVAQAAVSAGAAPIDVSTDLATRLHIGAGDTIWFAVSPTRKVRATVRGVYAVRETGFAGLAQISAQDLHGIVPDDQLAPTQLLTSASANQVRLMLDDPYFARQMNAAGYSTPYSVVPRAELLQTAERQSRSNLGLVFAVSVLALVALLSFVAREVSVFIANSRPRVEVLDVVGYPGKRTLRLLGVIAIVATAGSLAAAALVSQLAYTSGLLAPALPPALLPAWWVAAAAGTATATVVTLVGTRRVSRGPRQ